MQVRLFAKLPVGLLACLGERVFLQVVLSTAGVECRSRLSGVERPARV